MDIFIARQAVYDNEENVIGYELLYRSSKENKFDTTVDDKSATYNVINHLYAIGINELTHSSFAFINFPYEGIIDEVATLLPKDKVIIEILENVTPDQNVIKGLKVLKRAGYTIAIDDLINVEKLISYIDIVDIVKVDYLKSTIDDRKQIVQYVKNKDIKLLAEKIETEEELSEAKALGFELFQGYYFSKPTMIQQQDLVVKNNTIFNMMVELLTENVDLDKLDRIIKSDVVLGYKFLKFINSAYFNFMQPIKSFKNAIMLIGYTELKKWLAIMATVEISLGKSNEYANNTVLRAKFCELISKNIKGVDENSAFLVGLFSEIHVLINKNKEFVVRELPVDGAIKDALLGKDNIYKNILELVFNYEKMNQEQIISSSKKIGLDIDKLSDLYLQGIHWVDEINSENNLNENLN